MILYINITLFFFGENSTPDSLNYFKQFASFAKNTPHFYTDTAEGGMIKKVKRDFDVLLRRIFPHGNLKTASKAIFKYADKYKKGSYHTLKNSNTPTWNCIGPFSEEFSQESPSRGTGQSLR